MTRIIRIPLFISLALLFLCIWRPASAQESLLGAGDVVKITVYGQQDLETTTRVSKEGKITFPLIGEVMVGGLSSSQAEAEIAGRLLQGNFVKNPQVNLFVMERHEAENDLVTILGQVNHPGRFPVDTLSVAGAENIGRAGGAESIVGILALAGGVTAEAADYLTLTKKENGATKNYNVDLVALLKDGDLSQNYPLSGGDIVLVPHMDVFYIYGEVQKPGRFRLERNMTVMQALSVGGGLTPRGTEKGLIIKRRTKNNDVENIRVGLTDRLQPDDVIYVNESLF